MLTIVWLLGIVGVIIGIVALRKIKKSDGLLKGGGFAITGIVTSAISIVVFILLVDPLYLMPLHEPGRDISKRVACATNLRGLGKAMLIYAGDYDEKYPTADKWCDLLVQYANVDEKRFVCRSAGKGRCHYAINPNVTPYSHSRLVLLFETEGGWNQFGGPEILTTENHAGKGCNILFNDGHVDYLKLDELSELKWE